MLINRILLFLLIPLPRYHHIPSLVFFHNSSFLTTMVEGALQSLITLLVFTLLCLVVVRVILLFLPTVTLLTCCLKLTAFLVLANEGSSLPVLAKLLRVIVKKVWLPPEILPIVSVVTLGLVVIINERAPFSLEIEHVEVLIFCHHMDQPSFDVILRVSE